MHTKKIGRKEETDYKLREGVKAKPAAQVVRLTQAGTEESTRTSGGFTTEPTGLA